MAAGNSPFDLVVDQCFFGPDNRDGARVVLGGVVCPRSLFRRFAFSGLVPFAEKKTHDDSLAWGIVRSLLDDFRPASVSGVACDVLFLPGSSLCHPPPGFHERCRTGPLAFRGFVAVRVHPVAVSCHSFFAENLAHVGISRVGRRYFEGHSKRMVPACPMVGRFGFFCLFLPRFPVAEGPPSLHDDPCLHAVFRLGMFGVYPSKLGTGDCFVYLSFSPVAQIHAGDAHLFGRHSSFKTSVRPKITLSSIVTCPVLDDVLCGNMA